MSKTVLLMVLLVLGFIATAAGFEVGDRLSRLEPKAAGRIWFAFLGTVYVAKYWNEVKYPYLISLVSGLAATTVLVILAFA